MGLILPLAFSGLPQIAFANAPVNKRLVVVFLRGGLDGLSTVVPYGDPHYRSMRGNLALKENDESLIAVSDFFAFNSQLRGLAGLYNQGEVAVIHAAASPFNTRSHFYAQDLLENGTDKPNSLKTGWLNRTIGILGGNNDNTLGISLGPSQQLSMRGEAKVTSWSPSRLNPVGDNFLNRVAMMYKNEPLLDSALEAAIGNRAMTEGMKSQISNNAGQSFIEMMKATAGFLKQPNGPRIAAIDFHGFDTHIRQQNGAYPTLPRLLKSLDEGIVQYRQQTPIDIWEQTVVYVVTEFGRTVKPNGTGGTDHGTASMAMVIGGKIQGGQVVTQWPGLAHNRLFEGRDLAATTDLRSVSSSLLHSHFDIPRQDIDQIILPGSFNLNSVEIF
ncbi:DUF1501 domain-containing protein [Parendozoicomonas haliclonae]|nr:DUF1501 domain-containing protein [Parendozoicomonas haliclonae]